LIRKGCYFINKELVIENITWLKENDVGMYKLIMEELEVCNLDPDNLTWEEV